MSSTLKKEVLDAPLHQLSPFDVPCDTPLPYNLYVLVGTRYVKYRHEGHILETPTRERLMQDGLNFFFVDKDPATLKDEKTGEFGTVDSGPLDNVDSTTPLEDKNPLTSGAKDSTPLEDEELGKKPNLAGEDDSLSQHITGGAKEDGEKSTMLSGGEYQGQDNSMRIISSKGEDEEALKVKRKDPSGQKAEEAPEEKAKFDPIAQAKKNKSVINKLLQMEKQKPKDISVKVALAKAYITANRIDDSLQLYKRLKRKFMDSTAGSRGIIEVYLIKGWANKALAEYEEFEINHPDDPALPTLKAAIDAKIDEETAAKTKAREENAMKREASANKASAKLDKIFKK